MHLIRKLNENVKFSNKCNVENTNVDTHPHKHVSDNNQSWLGQQRLHYIMKQFKHILLYCIHLYLKL